MDSHLYHPRRSSFQKKSKHAHRFFKNQARIVEKIAESRFIQSASKADEVAEEYIPTYRFSDFPLSERLKQNITYQRYAVPTPIQDQAISHILNGSDLIGIANTGTGKTAAFLIPIIEKLSQDTSLRALIVAPTRELAIQIKTELERFSYGLGLSSLLCIGGTSMGLQKNTLLKNPRIVVGTPGRLKDLSQSHNLNLFRFGIVVLDEVDRMVDIGFIHDITYLISQLPKNRQSLFFSATLPAKASEILKDFVVNPITVSVKVRETAARIEQNIIKVASKEKKIDQLQNLLSQKEFRKVIIFGRTKWGIQKLTNTLLQRGFKAAAIHGNKSQNQRQKALEQFRTNSVQILLATDVASRGLDISDITHVINYDPPATYDDYVHRIGRTGRAERKGTALTFVD